MHIKLQLILAALLLAGCQDAGTYGERCSVPLAHWRKQSEGMNHHAIPVHLRLDSLGAAEWNGVVVTDSELSAYLDQSRAITPLPFIILSAQPDTSCDRVRAMRQLMDQRYCHVRWACGEGSASSRDWHEVMDLPPPAEMRRLEEKADAVAEAAEGCATPSDMEQIDGTSGAKPSDYRCRPINPESR